MSLRRSPFVLLVLVACSHRTSATTPSPVEIPVDTPLPVATDAQSACVERLIAPYIAKARATYPQAKQRFLAGLPTGYHLALTTKLVDSTGHFEHVFIRVDSIVGSRVYGWVNNDIYFVHGYHKGMPYSFDEKDLSDWTITDPIGKEEGNWVGNYLDTFQGKAPC